MKERERQTSAAYGEFKKPASEAWKHPRRQESALAVLIVRSKTLPRHCGANMRVVQ